MIRAFSWQSWPAWFWYSVSAGLPQVPQQKPRWEEDHRLQKMWLEPRLLYEQHKQLLRQCWQWSPDEEYWSCSWRMEEIETTAVNQVSVHSGNTNQIWIVSFSKVQKYLTNWKQHFLFFLSEECHNNSNSPLISRLTERGKNDVYRKSLFKILQETLYFQFGS